MYQKKADIKSVMEIEIKKLFRVMKIKEIFLFTGLWSTGIWNTVWGLQQFISLLNMNERNLLLGFQGNSQIPGVRWIKIFWRTIGLSWETNVEQLLWENDWGFRLSTNSTNDEWIVGKTYSSCFWLFGRDLWELQNKVV